MAAALSSQGSTSRSVGRSRRPPSPRRRSSVRHPPGCDLNALGLTASQPGKVPGAVDHGARHGTGVGDTSVAGSGHVTSPPVGVPKSTQPMSVHRLAAPDRAARAEGGSWTHTHVAGTRACQERSREAMRPDVASRNRLVLAATFTRSWSSDRGRSLQEGPPTPPARPGNTGLLLHCLSGLEDQLGGGSRLGLHRDV